MNSMRWVLGLASVVGLAFSASSYGQDDVADIASEEIRLEDDENQRYFLIGPRDDSKPEAGLGLILIMPGGDGSADFHPFVKRIYKYAVPEGYIVAQPVAVKWTDRQQIVWPTEKNKVDRMKFSTEAFLDAIIEDVASRHTIDPARVFTLSWSSSGPAAYAASLSSDRITGSFVGMSVFKPELLPKLDNAKGHPFFLYHSPEDRVCPYRMAQQAEQELQENGATVKMMTYSGGHGWRAGLYDHIRQGIEWLDENRNSGAAQSGD